MAKSISIGSLTSSTLPYELFKEHQQHGQFSLIIAPNNATALKLQQELGVFLVNESIEVFPDRETLPYDQFSPHQDITSERLRLLKKLPSLKKGLVIASIETLMHKVPPRAFIASEVIRLKVGETFNPLSQLKLLEEAGYHRVNQVLNRGEFSLRGAILDLFAMGSKDPIRIELFDDEIITLRYFDSESQRSYEEIETIEILPATEYPLNPSATAAFFQKWHENCPPNTFQSPLLNALKHQRSFGGLEYYLPFFFEKTAYLFDYLPDHTQILHVWNTYEKAEQFWEVIEERYRFCRYDLNRPALKPLDLFFHPTQLFSKTKQFSEIKFLEKTLAPSPNQSNRPAHPLPEMNFRPHETQPFSSLKTFIEQSGAKVLFCVESPGRREILMEHLSREKLTAKWVNHFSDFLTQDEPLGLLIAPIEHSFFYPDEGFALITEATLFSQFTPQARLRSGSKKSRKTSEESAHFIRDLEELSLNDAIVHIDYGIGRYLGLQTLSLNGTQNDCLVLEYLEGDKLFVPIEDLHLLSRYSGSEMQHAPINRLGTDRWQKDKEKALKRVHDVAAELLDVYARREAKPGFSFSHPGEDFSKFCGEFPFEETADQLAAVASVIDDMTSDRPMDRLLCGDVGFGKTEVAMRAAFIAAYQNKQVAILVPTTLLAQQHYESFLDRFAGWPISIEMISRFRTAEAQKSILKKVENGQIQILIGTHKLLSSEIKFKDLGLLIIDEEHRFGVKHKEQIKAFRSEVDILTLTATPIPRTLHMAFSDLRDLSLISTPPAKRLSVKTFVKSLEDSTLKEAISREVHRGGQVYYLFNDVSRIEHRKAELQKLFPDLSIGIGHGQMRERMLEKVMSDFYHNHYHVLLCSTIIETGIDIPNANTILIERADKFGLAQLHQLRGRVGRSHHQAYAYLLIPPWETLNPDAQKRLEAIQAASHLGAGFTLASHDLEIRGAGELLGSEQSGQIERIGFSLYTELLEKTIQAMKNGKTLDFKSAFESSSIEVDLGLSCLLPEAYLGEVTLRLSFYKRLSDCEHLDEITQIKVELIDRFGPLPLEAQHLLARAEIKLRAKALGIQKIKASAQYLSIEFQAHQTQVPVEKILGLLQKKPFLYKMKPPSGLLIQLQSLKEGERFTALSRLFEELQPKN